MTEVILTKVVETCGACPSQWDAWDLDGNYWYLRYRSAHGSAQRFPGPDTSTWNMDPPNISFDTLDDHNPLHGVMSLAEFCQRAGLTLHPEVELHLSDWTRA